MLTLALLLLASEPALTQGASSQHPNSFFTTESFATFAGATAITFVVANGIQRAFDYNPKWLALAIAIAVCETAVAISGTATLPSYLVALLNGFLVFSTAGGITSLPGKPNPAQVSGGVARGAGGAFSSPPPVTPKQRRDFLSSWF